MIRVAPEMRRKGVGRALIAFLKDYFSKQGIHFLLGSPQSNQSAPTGPISPMSCMPIEPPGLGAFAGCPDRYRDMSGTGMLKQADYC